jgi:hypothetical protein
MISKTNKIILLNPPKTASTSIIQNLYGNGVQFDFQKKIHLKLNEIVERHNVESLDEYKIIQITRDPYDRMISSYYHQMRILKSPEVIGNIPLTGYTFNEFLYHLNHTINSVNFIDDFYGDSSFINQTILEGKTWGGTRFYHTQSSWRNLDCNLYHFKLKDLIDDISPLSDLIKLNLKPLLMVNKNPLSIDYEKHKTKLNKEIIRKIFTDDFKNFNY